MPRKSKASAMWRYLDSSGVLNEGSDAEIKAAKREYRKQYFLKFKQRQRTTKPEFVVSYKKSNGDHGKIVTAAKRHNMSPTAFIRSSSLSYLTRAYIVPDRLKIAHLEQLLSDCLNEIQAIAKSKDRFFWQTDSRLAKIEKRIGKLEDELSNTFRNPPLKYDNQNQIA